jgi:hypothetical protein
MGAVFPVRGAAIKATLSIGDDTFFLRTFQCGGNTGAGNVLDRPTRA